MDFNQLEALRRPRGPGNADWFESLRLLNQDSEDVMAQLSQIMEEAEDFDMSSIGFRHHSISTQKRQDRILNDYRTFVCLYKKLGEDVSEEALDEACFPDPEGDRQPGCFNSLWRLLRPYLFTVTKLKTPRSHAHQYISYTTLAQYRLALCFWVTRMYVARNIEPPKTRHVFNQMTEVMRNLAVQFKLVRPANQNPNRVNVGLDDIRQLIDDDVRDTKCIELSEQHHLAICLARACALRPGSLGPHPKDKDDESDTKRYLTWGDIRITAGGKPGMWTVRVTIRNLKSSRPRDAEHASKHKSSMTFRITSPQQQSNLELSVPHRLLVIGIRRGVFQDVTSIDELFDFGLYEISIKNEFLDKPVLIAGKPRGLGLADDDRPLPSLSLTKWLQIRGERMGWPGQATFYSIRRQTSEDYVRILGTENTRTLMSHEPDSRTLERHYIDQLRTIDVAAATLGELVGSGDADELMVLEASADLSLSRLSTERIIQSYGPQLNALFRQYTHRDPGYEDLSGRTRANRNRVLRRRAFLALRQEIFNAFRRQQSIADREQRQVEILARATDFNKRLLAIWEEGDANENDVDEDLDNVDFGNDFEESADNDAENGLFLEQDCDVQMEPRDEEITVPEERDQSDATINYIAATSSIPYETAAKVSMTMMLDHTLGEYRPQGKVPCTLCQDDDTVDAERKEKLMTVGHLNEHLASDFHTGYKKWQRQAMIAREGNFFRCPYCTEVHPQHDSYSFKSLKDLLRHVRRSNSNKIANGSGWDTPALAAKHDKLKADAGWYDDDWTTNTSTEVKRGTTQRAEVVISKRKTRVKPLPQPVDVPGRQGLVAMNPGQQVGNTAPGPGVAIGPAVGMPGFSPTTTSLRLPGVIYDALWPGVPGWTPTFTAVPAVSIEEVPTPGTEGNMPGDGLLVSDFLAQKML